MTMIRAHFDGKTIVPDEPVNLPKDAPLFISVESRRPMTGRDLLESRLIGLWKDHANIGDSVEYARQLRQQAQARWRG